MSGTVPEFGSTGTTAHALESDEHAVADHAPSDALPEFGYAGTIAHALVPDEHAVLGPAPPDAAPSHVRGFVHSADTDLSGSHASIPKDSLKVTRDLVILQHDGTYWCL